MERRTFVSTAVAGGVAASLSSCGPESSTIDRPNDHPDPETTDLTKPVAGDVLALQLRSKQYAIVVVLDPKGTIAIMSIFLDRIDQLQLDHIGAENIMFYAETDEEWFAESPISRVATLADPSGLEEPWPIVRLFGGTIASQIRDAENLNHPKSRSIL